MVGASGYLVNLAVFALLTAVFDVHHIPAAIGAFCVAVTNNFWWNRHWTFDAGHGHAGFQAARFFTVSVLALGINLIVLELLVQGSVPDREVRVFLLTDGKINGEGKLVKISNTGWTKVVVPLVTLGSEDKMIDGFWVQNASGTDLPKFFVTEVRLQ